MAISYVGGVQGGRAGSTSTTTQSLNGTLTGGSNTSPSAGDLVLVWCSVGTNASYLASSQTISGNNNGTYSYTTFQSQADTYYSQSQLNYKIQGATVDTSLTIPSSGSNLNAQRWIVHVFRGVSASSPFDVTPVPSSGADTGRPNPTAITPTTAGAWIVAYYASAAATGAAYTAPSLSGWLGNTTADTYDVMQGGGYYSSWTSGEYDPPAITDGGTTGTGDSWTGMTLALSSSEQNHDITKTSAYSVLVPMNFLSDNFDDNSFDSTKWTRSNATQITESSQQLNLATTTSAAYYVFNSKVNHNLTGNSIYLNLKDAGDTTITSYEAYPLQLFKDSNNGLSICVIGSDIYFRKKVGGSYSTLATQTYSSTDHAWLKIREAGGTVYFDRSADGVSWTNVTSATVASLFDISSVQVDITAGTWQIEASTTTMIVDNINCLPFVNYDITKSAQYAVAIVSSDITKTADYDVAVIQTIQKAVAYVVTSTGTITKTAAYVVISSEDIAKTAQYQVATVHSIDKAVDYDVAISSDMQKAAVYAVAHDETVTKGSLYAVAADNELIAQAQYYVLTVPAVIQKPSDYDVAVIQTIQKAIGYVVLHSTDLTQNSTYVVVSGEDITAVAQYQVPHIGDIQKSSQYTVPTQADVTKQISYAVAVSSDVDKSVNYTVPSSSDITKAAAYVAQTIGTTAVTKNAQYAIETIVFNTIQSEYTVAVERSIGGGEIVCDYYPESNYYTVTQLRNGSFVGVSQAFTGNGGILSKSTFYLNKTGSPVGNVVSKVYAITGTYGSSAKPTGAALATSQPVDASTLSTDRGLIDFIFTGNVTLSNATYYAITVEFSGGSTGNTVEVSNDTSNPYTHSGNWGYKFGTTWMASSTGDAIFYVYTQDTGKIVSYCVEAEHTITKSAQYAVIGSDDISKIAQYVVQSVNGKTEPTQYVVISGDNITLVAQYSVSQDNSVTLQAAYEIIRITDIQLLAVYDVLHDYDVWDITKSVVYTIHSHVGEDDPIIITNPNRVLIIEDGQRSAWQFKVW